MEADDLLAAVFPPAAACQDNIVGPREIPDHILVRQTIDDTLHEALDIDGLRALICSIESGRERVHCRDTTEASVLSHEIITARPYAFLDDEEFQKRRTNAVSLRRGLNVDLAGIGALDPAAIDLVHEEVRPAPESPDELADLLSSVVVLRPRREWQTLFARLVAEGRGVTLKRHGGQMWVTTEGLSTAVAAFEGDDEAVVKVVRGYLELTGITAADALAAETDLPVGRGAYALEALRHEGFAFEGRYSPDASGPQWVARRLLARMHSYSRRSRRQSVDSASAQDFMVFLTHWQHVAPGSQLAGAAGLRSVLEALQGYEAAAVAWERELLARRVAHYSPSWLDALCYAGEAAWLRLSPKVRDDAEGPASSPAKATPITVAYRADLGWLLAAARSAGPPVQPQLGATAEILDVLRARGACFASDLAAATRRLPQDVERALWDGVSRGLIMCDGFEAIRARVAGTKLHSRPRRFSRAARPSLATATAAGRGSLVPSPDDDVGELDSHDRAEAVAEQLLNRWGVLFRALAVRDGLRMPWRDIQWALRRLEDRGLVRGGRFVSGFPGEQYALPDAVDALARIRRTARSGETVVVNATDPLNLVGIIVPGDTVPAVQTNTVTYVDGIPTH
jgi:ATP-dependent Lhr-like helicase